MTDKVEMMEVVDKNEQQWQLDIITMINEMHRGDDDRHDELLHLVEEPRRKPLYTLDFQTSYTDKCTLLSCKVSPVTSAIDVECNRCIRILLNAGASVSRLYRGNRTDLPLSYLVSSKGPHWMGSRDMVEELLMHGADVNAESDSGVPALTIAVCNGSPVTLIQVLLDKGAQITRSAWRSSFDCGLYDFDDPSALHSFNPSVLRVLLNHADKYKHVVPLHTLFSKLALQYDDYLMPVSSSSRSVWDILIDPAMLLSHQFVEILHLILMRGYIPDKNSPHTSYLVVKALRENSPEADKVVFMLFDKSPNLLQACRGALQGVALSPNFQTLLATPLTLQKMCGHVVISAIGYRYIHSIQRLGLPPTIIGELVTVKDTA